jgi:tetratricopeptide (TPR) repeat protein/tRNA A-37 threonylcarbamoyl transferase component Bud32
MQTDESESKTVLELVAKYIVAREAGWKLSLDTLCRETPALRKEVAYAIARHLESEQFFRPSEQAPPPVPVGVRGRIAKLRFEARGGMGEVFRAVDTRADREVAWKVIRPELNLPLLRDYFISEAKLTASLRHKAIVPVYMVDMDDCGRPAYSMEFIEGSIFHEIIELSIADPSMARLRKLLAHFVTVCEATQYAHDHKVTHGDIKAANVRIRTDGATFLMDWGLARRHPDGMTEEPLRNDVNKLAKLLDHILRGSNTPPALAATCRAALNGKYSSASTLGSAAKSWLDDGCTPDYRDYWSVRSLRWMNRHQTASTAIAAGLLFAFLISIASLWYSNELTERRRKDAEARVDLQSRLTPALREAEMHRDAGRWTDARASILNASNLAADERIDADQRTAVFVLRNQIEEEFSAAERDRQLQAALTRAIDLDERQVFAAVGYGLPVHNDWTRRLATAFREYGFDPTTQTTEQMIDHLSRRPAKIRDEVSVALRLWASEERNRAVARSIREVSKAISPNQDWEELNKLGHAALAAYGRFAIIGGLADTVSNGAERKALIDRIDQIDPATAQFGLLLEAMFFLEDIGEPKLGIRLLRQRVLIRPNEPFPLLCLASILQRNGASQDELLSVLQAARALNPDSGAMLIFTLVRIGRIHEAERVLADLFSRDPNNRILKVVGAVVALRGGHSDKGVQSLREALASGLDPTLIRPLLAVALFASGKSDEAEKEALEVAKLDPNEPCSLLVRGMALFRRGKWGDAETIFQKVKEDPAGRPLCTALLGAIAFLREGDATKAITLAEEAFASDPNDTATRAMAAMVFAITGQTDKAIRICKDGISLGQVSGELYLAYAIALAAKLDLVGCEKASLQALEFLPDTAAAEALLALSCLGQGRLDEARKWVEKSITTDPDDSMGHRVKVLILFYDQQWEKAVTHAEKLVQLLPKDLLARLDLARAYKLSGKQQAGEKVLKDAAAEFATDAAAQFQLVQTFTNAPWANRSEAIAACRRARDLSPAKAEYHNTLITLLRAEGKPKEILDALVARAEAFPRVTQYQNELGLFYAQDNRYDEALKRYKAGLPYIDTAPAAERPALTWATWSSIGGCLKRLDKTSEAVYPLQRSLETERPVGVPIAQLTETAWELGDAFETLERYPEARRSYRIAISYNPEAAGAYFGLGFCWLMEGNPLHAVEALKEATRLNPKLPHFRNRYAWALETAGEFEASVREYRNAIELDPEQVTASSSLVNLFMELGRDEEAENVAQATVKVVPKSPVAVARLATAYLRRNKYKEAADAQRRAAELAKEQKHRNLALYAQYATEYQRLAELAPDLPDIRAGKKKATEKGDKLAFARLLATDKAPAESAEWFEKVFAEASQPLSENGHPFLQLAIRQAGSGVASGGNKAATCRQLAFQWMEGELARLQRLTGSGNRTARADLLRVLRMWKFHLALESLRKTAADQAVLANERTQWGKFWTRVDEEIEAITKAMKKEADQE